MHICSYIHNRTAEQVVEACICSIMKSVEGNIQACFLLFVSSASQRESCNFRDKWLDWHWICLVNCCKGHAKEGLQMSNSRLWSLNLCKIAWIDILFQTPKCHYWYFDAENVCLSDNNNLALMDAFGRYYFDVCYVVWWAICCVIVVAKCYLEQIFLCPFKPRLNSQQW